MLSLALLCAPLCASAAAEAGGDPAPVVTESFIVGNLLAALAALVLNCLFTIAQTATAGLGPQASEDISKATSPYDRFLRRFLQRMPQLELQFQIAALLMLLFMVLLLLSLFLALFPAQFFIGSSSGLLFAFLLQVVVVEVLARNVALADTRRAFRQMVPVAYFLSLPVTPIMFPSFLFGAFSGAKRNSMALTDMHLRLLPSLSGVDRVLEEEAFEMIDSVREFAETTAERIMTPRTQVFAISDVLSPDEVFVKMQESAFSRVVVYHETLDNVVGTLLAKEVLLQRPADPFTLLRKPLTVSEKTRLPELLQVIRANRSHLVVIIDEYGGMAGIVTLHDLFEMIVGHIDEVDDKEELWIAKIGEHAYRLNGRVELWEVNEELGLELDESVARTIGGFIFNSLGRVPHEGDEIALQGVRMRVEKTDEKLVELLTLETQAPSPVTEKGD